MSNDKYCGFLINGPLEENLRRITSFQSRYSEELVFYWGKESNDGLSCQVQLFANDTLISANFPDAEYTEIEDIDRLTSLVSNEIFHKQLAAFNTSHGARDLKLLALNIYGSLHRKYLFSFLSRFIPMPSDDNELYGSLFEMMVYSINLWESPQSLSYLMGTIIENEQTTNGESYWLHNARGCHLFNLDVDNPLAYIEFALGSSKLNNYEDVYHISCGLDSMRPLEFEPQSFAPQVKAKPIEYCKPSITPSIVHLVAADAKYFVKYAEQILESIKSNRSNDLVCHLHVVNPDDCSLMLARKVAKCYPWVGITIENVNLSDTLRQRTLMAYYASARFLIAAEILSLYQAPLVITDIDLIITKDYEEIKKYAEIYPAALSYGISSLKRYYPWIRVGAQLSIFQYSKEGLTIAEYVGHYIGTTMALTSSSHNWLIDQIALWHAYEKFSREGYEIGKTRLAALGEGKK